VHLSIDLNCDLGEGAGCDAGLMPLITSANIACGAHAGDEATMRATVVLAREHGVAVGAHPGFADRVNFGREERDLSACALHDLVSWQIEALRELGPLRHVKPHGALYNMAARDRAVAEVIAEAVYECDRNLVLFGLAGGELVRAGQAKGLRVVNEVFADRTYQADGSLTPRSHSGALITDEAVAVMQVIRMVREGVVRATDGTEVSVVADTVCLHGDSLHAVRFARRLGVELRAAGIALKEWGT
jgi:5-oxoprolinase (ATP-hydrolysing) subunit A